MRLKSPNLCLTPQFRIENIMLRCSVSRYCVLHEALSFIIFLVNVGCRDSKFRYSSEGPTLATINNTLLITDPSRTVTKTFLGNFSKVASCVHECYKRGNCDLVSFDGRMCFGAALCGEDSVCQTAKNHHTSDKTVLLGHTRKNKMKVKKGPTRTQSGQRLDSSQENMKLAVTKEIGKRENDSHGRIVKLGIKKPKHLALSKKKTSIVWLQFAQKKHQDKTSRFQSKNMISHDASGAYLLEFQPARKKCVARRITVNATLRSGMDAGLFTLHGKAREIMQCVQLCCKDPSCDIAVTMAGRCYTVKCFTENDCEPKRVKGEATGNVIAYVDNPWKSYRFARPGIKQVHPMKQKKKIQKKTFVPNPSQGNIGDILDSIRFVNGPSIVTSSMTFGYFQQCALYTEPENVTKTEYGWVTPRYSPVSYLYQLPRGSPPPLGMRSAVPLGGMGTGSLELRADGTIHEWTLENQSPGGSAKLGPGALDLATVGVRVSSSLGRKAALLRTHPPPGYPGVQALSYSGSFPVSRLSVRDQGFFGVEMDLFAYGTLRPRQSDASFVPAIAFTLNVKNPTQKSVNVSFLLNLPLGVQTDTSRDGSNIDSINEVESPAQCASVCNENDRCMAWSYEKYNCTLKDAMPLHAYRSGVTSGVKGYWKIKGEKLICERPGNFPNSGTTTFLSINTNKPSFAVTDDFRSVWHAFETRGKLRKRIKKPTGFHGTISVGAKLPAGISETLTIILAWYYPYRDHAGQIVGNYYSKLFKSGVEVANHVHRSLVTNLKDIVSWQENIVPPKLVTTPALVHTIQSSLPVWLQDHLVNSLSFWRSGFRVMDGRWRQWEALDCNDVDSVHNDFQRELPYLLFFPELLENVVRAWATFQDQQGWIQETLQMQWGCHNRTNRLDTPGGRVMADVTPAFLAQFYHLYLWTGNKKLLQDLWPAARKAVIWLMRNSTGGTWLPLRQTCTYDIIYLEGYDHTIYNSIMYLLGMRVGQVLAGLQGESELEQEIEIAIDFGKDKIDKTLWDDEGGFYHAWWDHEKGSPDWLMADSLYGQVWAYALGLGDLLNPEKMKKHLRKESERNDTPYGLRVLTQGTADKPTTRSVTEHERNAFASLENFFTNVLGPIEQSDARKHNNVRENETDWESGKIFKAKRNLTTGVMKTKFTSVGNRKKKSGKSVIARTKIAHTEKLTGQLHNAERRSFTTPLTQQNLNHNNCFAVEQESRFNSIWMGSDSDWTTLQIHLREDPIKALKQAEKALEHYRTGLNDFWNIHGLTAGQGYGVDGQPWCTSHYTFHMVLWHIPLAISGQQYTAVEKRLTFEPKLNVPYALPFFTPFAGGTIEARASNDRVKYTVTVTSGRLEVDLLAISRSMFPNKAIGLEQGEYVSWERK